MATHIVLRQTLEQLNDNCEKLPGYIQDCFRNACSGDADIDATRLLVVAKGRWTEESRALIGDVLARTIVQSVIVVVSGPLDRDTYALMHDQTGQRAQYLAVPDAKGCRWDASEFTEPKLVNGDPDRNLEVLCAVLEGYRAFDAMHSTLAQMPAVPVPGVIARAIDTTRDADDLTDAIAMVGSGTSSGDTGMFAIVGPDGSSAVQAATEPLKASLPTYLFPSAPTYVQFWKGNIGRTMRELESQKRALEQQDQAFARIQLADALNAKAAVQRASEAVQATSRAARAALAAADSALAEIDPSDFVDNAEQAAIDEIIELPNQTPEIRAELAGAPIALRTAVLDKIRAGEPLPALATQLDSLARDLHVESGKRIKAKLDHECDRSAIPKADDAVTTSVSHRPELIGAGAALIAFVGTLASYQQWKLLLVVGVLAFVGYVVLHPHDRKVESAIWAGPAFAIGALIGSAVGTALAAFLDWGQLDIFGVLLCALVAIGVVILLVFDALQRWARNVRENAGPLLQMPSSITRVLDTAVTHWICANDRIFTGRMAKVLADALRKSQATLDARESTQTSGKDDLDRPEPVWASRALFESVTSLSPMAVTKFKEALQHVIAGAVADSIAERVSDGAGSQRERSDQDLGVDTALSERLDTLQKEMAVNGLVGVVNQRGSVGAIERINTACRGEWQDGDTQSFIANPRMAHELTQLCGPLEVRWLNSDYSSMRLVIVYPEGWTFAERLEGQTGVATTSGRYDLACMLRLVSVLPARLPEHVE